MLIFWRLGGAAVFSEAIIVLTAAAGFFAAVAGRLEDRADRNLVRFVAFYTAVLAVGYSIIPYKTPWCMLGFLHGMTILAGVGTVFLLRIFNYKLLKTAVAGVIIIASCHLIYQAYMANYRYYDDPVNPYVYAHTSRDIYKAVEKIEEAASCANGRRTYIEVICPGNDYWPLPWYLRGYSSVAWCSEVDSDSPPGAVIIASPRVQPALVEKLYRLPPPGQRQLYVPLFDDYTELRPKVELVGFVKAELWQGMRQGDLPDLSQ
jgi:predicted membrane-bound mannosyltransferase